MEINYKPIGIIHTPFKEVKGTPIQSVVSNATGFIEIFPEYIEGLKDLEEFSHIILIYHFNLCKKSLLKLKPYMDNMERGVFSTRAPSRPNPIGISIVRLLKVEKNILHIKDVDIVDGTPLLDIKPYIPQFDIRNGVNIGWLKENIHKLSKTTDNGRFQK